MTARITTLIPTYRRPALLARAIQSVLDQTIPELKVLVHDNASGDETASVIARFQALDSRVHYHCHSKNIGAAANFNSLLDKVDTPFFSIMSDDDVLMPTFYSSAMLGFSEFPEAYFAATEVLYIDNDNRFRGYSNRKFCPGLYTPPSGLISMLDGNHPPTWTGILFRKEVIEEVGVLDERVGPTIDYDYVYRTAARRSYVVCRDPGAIFLLHAQSTGAQMNLRRIWPAEKYMIENIATATTLSPEVRARARKLLSASVEKRIFYYGRQAIKQHNPDEALTAARILQSEFSAYLTCLLLWFTAIMCRFSSATYTLLTSLNLLRNSAGASDPHPAPPDLQRAIDLMRTLERKVAPILTTSEPAVPMAARPNCVDGVADANHPTD